MPLGADRQGLHGRQADLQATNTRTRHLHLDAINTISAAIHDLVAADREAAALGHRAARRVGRRRRRQRRRAGVGRRQRGHEVAVRRLRGWRARGRGDWARRPGAAARGPGPAHPRGSQPPSPRPQDPLCPSPGTSPLCGAWLPMLATLGRGGLRDGSGAGWGWAARGRRGAGPGGAQTPGTPPPHKNEAAARRRPVKRRRCGPRRAPPPLPRADPWQTPGLHGGPKARLPPPARGPPALGHGDAKTAGGDAKLGCNLWAPARTREGRGGRQGCKRGRGLARMTPTLQGTQSVAAAPRVRPCPRGLADGAKILDRIRRHPQELTFLSVRKMPPFASIREHSRAAWRSALESPLPPPPPPGAASAAARGALTVIEWHVACTWARADHALGLLHQRGDHHARSVRRPMGPPASNSNTDGEDDSKARSCCCRRGTIAGCGFPHPRPRAGNLAARKHLTIDDCSAELRQKGDATSCAAAPRRRPARSCWRTAPSTSASSAASPPGGGGALDLAHIWPRGLRRRPRGQILRNFVWRGCCSRGRKARREHLRAFASRFANILA